MQEEYKRYMVQVKAWQIYIKIYKEHSYRWDQMINIFIALMSSTSIAAWAIWQKFSYIWAILIAASQVVIAIKSWLPFAERMKVLVLLESDLNSLFNKIELNWYQVCTGKAQDDQIVQWLYDFKSDLADMEQNHLKNVIIPERSDYKEQADRRTEEYFQMSGMRKAGKQRTETKMPLAEKLPTTNVKIKELGI